MRCSTEATAEAKRLLGSFSRFEPPTAMIVEYAAALALAPDDERKMLVGDLIGECEKQPGVRQVKSAARALAPPAELQDCGFCAGGWVEVTVKGIAAVIRCPTCYPDKGVRGK